DGIRDFHVTGVQTCALPISQTLLFPDSPLSELLMGAALLTMIVGILGAIAQSDLKRMLSFTLVSHIGYMVFGIGVATVAGFSGEIGRASCRERGWITASG